MFSLFKKKPLIHTEAKDFQIDCYKWLLTYFGGADFYEATHLILPTKQFFPANASSPEELAFETFGKVKEYAGMEKWPCRLELQEEDPDVVVAPTVVLQNTECNPLGTFRENEENEIVITYNPVLNSNPTQMVATFAHELSHYLTSSAPVPPPGGYENWEFATDICSSFLGFGIFAANAAFNFSQYTDIDSQGWQTTGGGYLSEQEHSYALAIFLLLREVSPDIVYPYCDTNIKAYVKNAYNELKDSTEIIKLRNIKYIEMNS